MARDRRGSFASIQNANCSYGDAPAILTVSNGCLVLSGSGLLLATVNFLHEVPVTDAVSVLLND